MGNSKGNRIFRYDSVRKLLDTPSQVDLLKSPIPYRRSPTKISKCFHSYRS